MAFSPTHAGQGASTFAYPNQEGAYQASIMRCLPVELLVRIISLTIPEKKSCTLALVRRHWKQIIENIHPFHLLKQRRFAASLKGFYFYSHVGNEHQVDEINQALKGWLPAFIANCRNAKQAAFTLENMWLTPFSTDISSSNQELANTLAILRQLQTNPYIPCDHLKMILQAHGTIPFPKRLLTTAIQLGYLSLQDIPQKLRCYTIYLVAVQYNGLAIRFVPDELRTPDICAAAVQQTV